jgi:hypothetical protein
LLTVQRKWRTARGRIRSDGEGKWDAHRRSERTLGPFDHRSQRIATLEKHEKEIDHSMVVRHGGALNDWHEKMGRNGRRRAEKK